MAEATAPPVSPAPVSDSSSEDDSQPSQKFRKLLPRRKDLPAKRPRKAPVQYGDVCGHSQAKRALVRWAQQADDQVPLSQVQSPLSQSQQSQQSPSQSQSARTGLMRSQALPTMMATFPVADASQYKVPECHMSCLHHSARAARGCADQDEGGLDESKEIGMVPHPYFASWLDIRACSECARFLSTLTFENEELGRPGSTEEQDPHPSQTHDCFCTLCSGVANTALPEPLRQCALPAPPSLPGAPGPAPMANGQPTARVFSSLHRGVRTGTRDISSRAQAAPSTSAWRVWAC